ncbi:MAG: hypothetical protein KDA92_06550 [Planctomycetales bacterium]|nr:hypothetical protein [Planctomycetales bacterium]
MSSIAHNESFQTMQAGFLLYSQGHRFEYQDQDVLGIRIDTQRQCDLLGEANTVESLQLRVRGSDDASDSRVGWVTLTNELGPFDADRLGPLRDRLLDDLWERSNSALCRGDDVSGDGWTLSLMAFTDHQSGNSCFPQQIAKVKWIDDELCLWHEDEEEPFARYARSAENSLILYRLLGQFVDTHDPAEPAETGVGLGRRLNQFTTFHRHPLPVRRLAVQMSLMLAGLLCCMSLYSMGVGIVLVMVVIASALPLLRGYSETLKHFERGLVWSSGNREQLILFEQLEWFSADWQQPPGSQSGTVSMVFETRDHRRIHMTLHFDEKSRTSAEAIQTHASAIIAENMRQDLVRQGRTVWTDRLSILRNGLEDRPLPAGPIHVLTFDEIERYALATGKLTLWIKGAKDPIQQPTTQLNFYPGLMLLNMQGIIS